MWLLTPLNGHYLIEYSLCHCAKARRSHGHMNILALVSNAIHGSHDGSGTSTKHLAQFARVRGLNHFLHGYVTLIQFNFRHIVQLDLTLLMSAEQLED